MSIPVLEMKNITKTFGKFVALNDVTLSVDKAEVHALLGENGAGKSTLMNCLFGMFDHFEGQVFFDGEEVNIKDPLHAIDLGIGMVHQHFMLIPVLTVIENVVLGLKGNKAVLDLKTAAEKFVELGKKYHMEIDPWARVEQLSVGQQQRLEILKALYREAKLLILDEPTAVLTPEEIDGLFEVIERLRSEGHTVIFISHKLNEIMRVCDRCTILRLGRVEATVNTKDIKDRTELASLMVGRSVDLNIQKKPANPGEEVLSIKDLCCENDLHLPAVKNMSFSIRSGEILGVCGVDGNGQSELIQCITGLRTPTSGHIYIKGEETTYEGARRILDKGVGHIPEDRMKFGMMGNMSVEENMVLVSYGKKPFSLRGWLAKKFIRKHSTEICDNFNVKTPTVMQEARNLSGGNQQKMVVGRELDRNPDFLIAVHPSRGLDIGATKYIQNQILEQRDAGAAVLFVSTELDELLEMSDRIIVVFDGKIMGTLKQEEATREILGSLMAGICDIAVPVTGVTTSYL